MKTKAIILSQADKLEALSYFYKLSPIQILDWSLLVLWREQSKKDLGLLTLLELKVNPAKKDPAEKNPS